MATREYGPTGIAESRPMEISPKIREQLRAQLNEYGVETIPEEFFGALALAAGHYKCGKAIHEESKPSAVRANLKKAIDAALELNEKLNALDGNSRDLLAEAGAEINQLQGGYLREIIMSLNNALNLAHEYPKKGRLPDYESLWFAVDIGRAMEDHLSIIATQSRAGPFESALTIMLEFVTGGERSGAQDLAGRAIKAMRLNAPGEYEHVPLGKKKL